QIAFHAHKSPDAPLLLVAAGKRLEPLDPVLAESAYLDAFGAALWIGHRAREVAHSVPIPTHPTRPVELLLARWAQFATKGFPAGADLLKRALVTLGDEPVAQDEELRWLWFGCRLAKNFLDLESLWSVSARYVQVARDTGALTELPGALNWLGTA